MDHLRRLGNQFSIPISPDENGFTGRECPQSDCKGYFKIEFGTGLKGEDLPCHCPYCGYTDGHDHFWTKGQIEYAHSIASKKITDAIVKDFKKMEFDHKPKGPFGIGVSMKLISSPSIPIHYYREKKLETEVICSNCTLRYSIYGIFAFCPDCGQHNSLQILEKNLEVVEKMLDFTLELDKDLADRIIENALEDCVSAFDGFGRELCRVHKKNASDPKKAVNVSFQNLEGSKSSLLKIFNIDISSKLTTTEWEKAICGFQKRHLVAHKMGIIDQNYKTKTDDTKAIIGRKINISANEVKGLLQIIQKIAINLSQDLQKSKRKS